MLPSTSLNAVTRVLVTGSRSWTDYATIFNRLKKLPRTATIVHGAAEGADTLADQAAEILGMPREPHPIHPDDWRAFGRAAGPLRNHRMFEYPIPQLVLAFRMPGRSSGTDHCVRIARRRYIPVEIFHGKV